jgi:CHASE3 domain sensor protein
LYKKIEANERQREEKERAEQEGEGAMAANTRYWMGLALSALPILLAIGAIAAVLYLIASMWS